MEEKNEIERHFTGACARLPHVLDCRLRRPARRLRGGGGGDHSGAPDATTPNATEIRTVKSLAQGWRFVQDDALTDKDALANEGNNWSSVTLPHTWNATDAASIAQTGPNTIGYKRGKGWYRLEFDHNGDGATQWLQFDGACIVADVWLNGEKLGQHRGAFTAFRFDVTGKLNPGKNVLVVKTDNSAATSDASLTAIAPLAGDFNMSGGLYRGVSLLVTSDAAHFALNEPVVSSDPSGNDVTQFVAGAGVYARTLSVDSGAATIKVLAKVKNDSAVGGDYTVTASLLEADGETLKASVQQKISLEGGTEEQTLMNLAVNQPHLWQGLEDPYLYKLVVELKNDAGSISDKVIQDFGVRQMVFDPDKGFFLNGKSTPLHGVNMHQDYLGKAWAISDEDTDESFALIKELGANTLRSSHYPHASYTYQQAARLGLVVMPELPFVNASSLDCNGDPEATGFAANARLQLQELIRQQYNHASIGLWSIGNETNMSGGSCGHTTDNNNVTSLLRSLHSLAKAEDPGRPTTLANHIDNPGTQNISDAGITDIYSVNRYYQWYASVSETQLALHLDDVHAQNPTQPLGVSEYGAGAALTHHTDNPYGGRVCILDTTGRSRICYQPEEYAGYVHEKNYAALVGKEYLYGTYIWNMFDYGSGLRHEGDIGAANTKGLVTFDRKTRKDPFFFYKANWSKEPVTYIAGRRYTQRAYPVADIKLYSNASEVTLSVNGVAVGAKTAADCPLRVCEFKGINLAAGANSITALGTHSGKTVTDTVTWNLSDDNANNIYIAAGQLTTGFRSTDPLLGNHMYGSDNFFSGGNTPSIPFNPSSFVNIPLFLNVAIANLGSSTVPETGRVWDVYREGAAFSYQIPLANGNYRVTLGFLEPTATAPGARVFSVDANGLTRINNLDIFSVAGARNAAIAESFDVVVSGGVLKLDFNGIVGNAIVSNIAVVRQ
jgi:beta-galactosidase